MIKFKEYDEKVLFYLRRFQLAIVPYSIVLLLLGMLTPATNVAAVRTATIARVVLFI
jgi:hypothetical protein